MDYPKDFKYTKDHEWAKLENGEILMGITDYAQDELGDIVFIELPAEGTEVTKGEDFIVVESVKAVSDVYAPVSGEVVEVNNKLENSPELVNKSPHDKGWMVRIKVSDKSELDGLLDQDEYVKLTE